MTVRIYITGDPAYDDEHHVSAMLESEFRLAAGQVIELDDRTTGTLHEIIQELVGDHANLGLTDHITPGDHDVHLHFGGGSASAQALSYTRLRI